jgi:membrane protein YqaA with SNARE-associated domain
MMLRYLSNLDAKPWREAATDVIRDIFWFAGVVAAFVVIASIIPVVMCLLAGCAR